jgi:hypothetical protein
MVLREVIIEAVSNVDMFSVSCVSKRFREVTFRISLFWEKVIFVPTDNRNRRSSEMQFSRMKHFLEPAWTLRNAPKRFSNNRLDIVIKDTEKRHFTHEDVARIVNILSQTRARRLDLWRSLRIEVSEEEVVQEFSNLLCGKYMSSSTCNAFPFPSFISNQSTEGPVNLESLELVCRHDGDLTCPPTSLFRGFSLPRLRVAFIKRVNVDWAIFRAQLKKGSLEDLHLESIYIHQEPEPLHFIEILRSSPSLHTLTLIDSSIAVPSHKMQTTLSLTNLKRMRVGWSSSTDLFPAVGSFSILNLPSLRELSLHDFSSERGIDFDFVQQSDQLRTLIPVLRCWPYCESLATLRLRGIKGDFSGACTLQANQIQTLLSIPALRSLKTVILEEVDEVIVKALIPFVSNRNNINSAIVDYVQNDNRRPRSIACALQRSEYEKYIANTGRITEIVAEPLQRSVRLSSDRCSRGLPS